MGSTTPTNSQPLHLKKSRSTSSRIENPSISISESLTDLRFPQELITEILLRLPVKSLLKFKCVSKPWLSLISSPRFIRHHFSISSREDKYFNHQLLYTARANMKQCSLYSALHEAEPSEHVSDIAYPSQIPDYPPLIVGIVNGLVCLATGAAGLFLWNPVLRKFKHMNANLEAPFSGLAFNYGIGYDELNDDYKVVCFLRLYGSENVFESEVNLYSVRADSWRRIGDLKGFLPSNDSAIYANGKIYWSACVPAASTHDKKIISLDMVSEKFGEVQQPDYEPDYYYWKLGVLCGRPFVLCDYKGTKADLWVMDKYGVEESWCKMVSIPYDNVHPRTPYSHQQFVCILSNGEIVFENGFGLLVYNSNRKEFRNIELAVGKSSYMKASAYVESLVWPYG